MNGFNPAADLAGVRSSLAEARAYLQSWRDSVGSREAFSSLAGQYVSDVENALDKLDNHYDKDYFSEPDDDY